MRLFRATTGLLLLCGCNGILGIEELKHRADAVDAGGGGQLSESRVEGSAGGSNGSTTTGTAGSGGKTGSSNGNGGNSGGKSASNGGTGASASGANAGARSEPAAGSGGAPGSGGTTSQATAGTGNTAGTAGAAPSGGPGAVRGRVIDFRRNPVPDVPVKIGDLTTRTDMDGRFTLDAVPARYDVTLSIRTTINSGTSRGAWQFQGLTRRDPTLQVYRGLPGQSASVHLQATNVTFPLRAEQRLEVTWASPQGELQTDLSSAPGVITDANWIGGQTSAGNAHALLFEVSGNPETPVSYTAHDTKPIMLQDGAREVPIDFDMAPHTITADKVSGKLVGPRDNPVLHFFLRFTDDTALALPSIYPRDSDTFSFLAPKLSAANLTVLFENSNNGLRSGESAVFLDNVEPGQTELVLTLPSIPTLTSPPIDKMNVGPETEFEWSGNAKVYLLCAESTTFYENACVLTSSTKARLPVAPQSDYVPSANNVFSWTVETHGSWNSVDEATGEGGFISAGYRLYSLPQVPRGPGSYATSATWTFVTPP